MSRRLGRSQSWSPRFGKKKTLLHLPKIDAQSVGWQVCSRVTTPTELCRLPIEHLGLRNKIGAGMCFLLPTSHFTLNKWQQLLPVCQSVSQCDRLALHAHCRPAGRLVSRRGQLGQLLQLCASATGKVTGRLRAVTRGHNMSPRTQ